jgi:3-oxoisoapionate kinase
MPTDPITAAPRASPPGSGLDLLLSFYGDDFTGSTDVMESLALAGLRTVLFMKAPSREQLAGYEGLRAFGIAGRSRTMSPEEMEVELRPVFESLRSSGAPVVHYKVCSTFDSSPEVGSIGRAIDIAASVFGSSYVPLVVGAPVLGRYCVFGNLFARSGLDSEPSRLDRHPTMKAHPITPMDESDLRLHLARQTRKRIGLFDVLKLESSDPGAHLDEMLQTGVEIVLFDTLYDRHLPIIGGELWSRADEAPPFFVAGSSGADYALAAYWRQEQVTEPAVPAFDVRATGQLVVVSGSCSPVTARQIDLALREGFADVAVRTSRLFDRSRREEELERLTREGLHFIRQGKSVILHTALGPEDPRLTETTEIDVDVRMRSGFIIGNALGRLLGAIMRESGLERAAVTGGDTSWYVAEALGIESLEMLGRLAPGSPLCRIHAPGMLMHGAEIVFKGGQVGRDTFFLEALGG